MPILHGTFDLESSYFILWGEADTPNKRRGGRPLAIPRHPFALTGDALVAWCREHIPQLVPAPEKASLWLPSAADRPQASPELRATGAFAEDESAPLTLKQWQAPCVVLYVDEAIDLLLALGGRRDDIGQSLVFWRAAMLEALALVNTHQVIPGLKRDGVRYSAYWHILPEEPERLRELSKQMPPICRAHDPESSPDALMQAFIAHVVETTIQATTPSKFAAKLRGIGAAWWESLTGDDSSLKASPVEADKLFQAWQSWADQGAVAGNNAFRIAFRLSAPEDGKADFWRLEYLLQATDDPSLLVTAAQIWRGKQDAYLLQRFDQPQERLLRGLAFAGRLFAPILASLRSKAPTEARFDTEQAYTFLRETTALLQASGFRVLLPRWWGTGGKKARVSVRSKVSGGKANSKAILTLSSLLSVDHEVLLGGEPISYDEFMQLAALKQPLVRVRGQWVVLDAEQIEAGLRFFEKSRDQLSLEDALRMGLDPDSAGNVVDSVTADGWLKTLLNTLTAPDKIKPLPPPDDLHAELRPYQERGYAWLMFLRRYGLGACLADDMGLGKTITTIAFLLRVKADSKVSRPALVVCPTSVVGNWRHELRRFAPGLTAYTHQGAERSAGDSFQQALDGVDVVLTSYPLLARDRETLESVQWSTVVLDEAQNIKNHSTKQAQAARALNADHRVALTGTPIENRLTELWSIFHFLNPGYLGSEKTFRQQFANPIEKYNDAPAAARLRRLSTPFILRRLKTDPTIISDLPDKMEMKVYTTLTTEQGTLYEAVAQDTLQRIQEAEESGESMARRGLVLSLLMQLKQICNHPAQYLKDGSLTDGRSGKLARLTEMLEEVYAEDDRALIFTQFAEMGELIRHHLRETFTDEPLWLHGGTKVPEREAMIRRFQAERGPRVFILSLKAGGVGLNLTRANHVFHFDRWWNPAVENQATDRAFRIGQTKNVQVHKFITAGTLEEKIDEMIESKKALAESIVGADESWLTELDTASLRDLVQLRETGA